MTQSEKNKAMLQTANAAIDKGKHEEFLAHCTEDTTWEFVGDITLHGKEEIRQWMKDTYLIPPVNMVHHLISEGEFVVAEGVIKVMTKEGTYEESVYCDVWQFRGNKMAHLKAFVLKRW